MALASFAFAFAGGSIAVLAWNTRSEAQPRRNFPVATEVSRENDQVPGLFHELKPVQGTVAHFEGHKAAIGNLTWWDWGIARHGRCCDGQLENVTSRPYRALPGSAWVLEFRLAAMT